MDINNKARIHWACRRGMRELDISIMPFSSMSMIRSAMTTNVCLFACLSRRSGFVQLADESRQPADAELQRMVKLIQTRNRERGPVAI
jgi:antitoxin CptB